MSSVIQPGAAAVSNEEHPAAPQTPIIDLQDLSVRFGNRDILKNLVCTLRGASDWFAGSKRAGKSTLINTLLGFERPTSGLASVLGYDISNRHEEDLSLVGDTPRE